MLFLAGCQFKVPGDPYTLVQNLSTDPETLNPVIASSVYASSVYGLIYEQLFTLDNQTTLPKPVLAQRWEISKDHLQYTFFLRGDVKWQDGVPFTADDVIYTYDKIQDPKVDAASARNYFRDVLKVEKLDDHTVRFTYRQPYVGALYTLGLMTVIPKHVFDNGLDFNSHPANRRPVGTGPFQFMEWQTGQRIVLKKNESYWGEPYAIRKMFFKIIPDDLSVFQLFKKGEIDVIDLTPLQWARQTESKKFLSRFVKHKMFTRFGSNYSYIGWNELKPFFQDKRVRRALSHLVDRGAIDQKLLFDLYLPITGPFYPLGPNYDKTLKQIEYNELEAARLLDEAGWKDTDGDGLRDKNGVPLRFTLLFSSGLQYYEQLTPILRKNFRQAGIELNLRRLDGISMFKMIEEKDFDAYLAAWGRGAGEEDLYQIWHSSQANGGSNFISYANPEVDHLLEEARREFDDTRRAGIQKSIHRLLYEDQPYTFMFARPELTARSARFKNVKEYPLGLDVREWLIED